jgi:hypothetical protein
VPAGTRGQIPKRSTERLGHSMGDADTRSQLTIIEHDFNTVIPGENSEWHEYAKWWYRSLRVSGQSKWYENSDWMMAFLAADILSDMLDNGYRAGMVAEWNSMCVRLNVTEADRRHSRIELVKTAINPDEQAGQIEVGGWQNALAGEVVVE